MISFIKKCLAFILITSVFISCTKTETIEPLNSIELRAKNFLKTQISREDFQKLDWTKIKQYKKLGKTEIINVPFIKDSNSKLGVIYLRVIGDKFAGNYFKQEGDSTFLKITTTSLNKSRICKATIENNVYGGDYEIFEDGVLVSSSIASSNRLVMIKVPSSIVYNHQLHLLIQMLGIGQNGWYPPTPENLYTYLIPADDGANPGGGGGGDILDVYIGEAETETMEYNSGPNIDLQKYKNCFDLVNSVGATYTIKLCADIPVNGEPHKINTLTDPGHVFMTFTKTNGPNSVTQSFGFYPRNRPVALLGLPVSSKIVDDRIHEYNASIQMNVTEANFLASFSAGQTNATSSYDINDYNCAYFALDNFNAIRTNPLHVPDTYTNMGAFFGKTPVGLYQTLRSRKLNNDPEHNNIEIGVFTSPLSHGPCN